MRRQRATIALSPAVLLVLSSPTAAAALNLRDGIDYIFRAAGSQLAANLLNHREIWFQPKTIDVRLFGTYLDRMS